MHHIILSNTQITDHINGNILDNRKQNLRISTPSLNGLNKHRMSTNTSGVIGVSYSEREEKWRARIQYKYIEKSAYFSEFEDAVKCRKQWEEEIFNNNY